VDVGTRVVLSRTYQSLHRLHGNGIKLSELVGLVTVNIAGRSKNLKTLRSDPKGGTNWAAPAKLGLI
jgi:hypothetical protein